MSRKYIVFVLALIAIIAAFLLGVLYAQPRLFDDGRAWSWFPPLMWVRFEDPEIGMWCYAVSIPWRPEALAVDCEPEGAFGE